MRETLDQLSSAVPNLSPQLRRAAYAVLAQPNQVAVMSMRALAQKAGVAPPTMLRLARAVGFLNYEAFRDVFKQSVATPHYGERATWLREIGGRGGAEEVVGQTAQAAERNVASLFHGPTALHVERIAGLLLSARDIYIAAAGSPHGLGLSFQYVGRMAFQNLKSIPMGGASIHDGMTQMGSNDALLALSVNPYARPTVDAVRFARTRGAAVAVITDSEASPLATQADAVVLVETDSPHFFPSMIAMAAALEALLATMVSMGGPDMVAKISEADSILHANDAYWRGR